MHKLSFSFSPDRLQLIMEAEAEAEAIRVSVQISSFYAISMQYKFRPRFIFCTSALIVFRFSSL